MTEPFLFMNRDIETFSKEELITALKWCCKRINELDTPDDVRMRVMNRRNVNAQLFKAKPIEPPKDLFEKPKEETKTPEKTILPVFQEPIQEQEIKEKTPIDTTSIEFFESIKGNDKKGVGK